MQYNPDVRYTQLKVAPVWASLKTADNKLVFNFLLNPETISWQHSSSHNELNVLRSGQPLTSYAFSKTTLSIPTFYLWTPNNSASIAPSLAVLKAMTKPIANGGLPPLLMLQWGSLKEERVYISELEIVEKQWRSGEPTQAEGSMTFVLSPDKNAKVADVKRLTNALEKTPNEQINDAHNKLKDGVNGSAASTRKTLINIGKGLDKLKDGAEQLGRDDRRQFERDMALNKRDYQKIVEGSYWIKGELHKATANISKIRLPNIDSNITSSQDSTRKGVSNVTSGFKDAANRASVNSLPVRTYTTKQYQAALKTLNSWVKSSSNLTPIAKAKTNEALQMIQGSVNNTSAEAQKFLRDSQKIVDRYVKQAQALDARIDANAAISPKQQDEFFNGVTKSFQASTKAVTSRDFWIRFFNYDPNQNSKENH